MGHSRSRKVQRINDTALLQKRARGGHRLRHHQVIIVQSKYTNILQFQSHNTNLYNTFQSVNYWVDECEQQGLCSDIPKVLVGMKCDKEDKRIVSYSNAQRLADSHGMPVICFEDDLRDDFIVILYDFFSYLKRLHLWIQKSRLSMRFSRL